MRNNLIMLLIFFISIPAFSQELPPPQETEVWEPVPEVITPGELNHQPPSDAIVLFDSGHLDEWVGSDGNDAEWIVEGDFFTVRPKTGSITTRRSFGDCQLHIEWRSPAEVKGKGQGRGNSGVFLMGRYEVQVLDSYDNQTYSNGQAASIYKQHIPLVNACRKPGEWQTYDIIFTAPVFAPNGELTSPAYVTVFHNGILVQNHVELEGPTVYRGKPSYKAHESELPLSIQDHGNPVSFRNIWIREL